MGGFSAAPHVLRCPMLKQHPIPLQGACRGNLTSRTVTLSLGLYAANLKMPMSNQRFKAPTHMHICTYTCLAPPQPSLVLNMADHLQSTTPEHPKLHGLPGPCRPMSLPWGFCGCCRAQGARFESLFTLEIFLQICEAFLHMVQKGILEKFPAVPCASHVKIVEG